MIYLLRRYFILLFLLVSANKVLYAGLFALTTESDSSYIEFRRGDILVKANNSWLPGSCYVPGGTGFGHAVIVLKGSEGYDPEKVLAEAEIMESHARDVPSEFQIRKIKGYSESSDNRFSNVNFGNLNEGIRYRLRPDITESQIEKVIEYIVAADSGESSWRALKKSAGSRDNYYYWYCSLLIYQAFKDVLDIDLDTNGGLVVFPNDIIVSPEFDYESGRLVF